MISLFWCYYLFFSLHLYFLFVQIAHTNDVLWNKRVYSFLITLLTILAQTTIQFKFSVFFNRFFFCFLFKFKSINKSGKLPINKNVNTTNITIFEVFIKKENCNRNCINYGSKIAYRHENKHIIWFTYMLAKKCLFVLMFRLNRKEN